MIHGDGTTLPFDFADVIYVNAGVTRPADHWLDRLKHGGRLVLPLTASGEAPAGAVFCFTRHGEEFCARMVSPTAFIPCEGMRDQESGEALAAAFAKGGVERVARLVRGGLMAVLFAGTALGGFAALENHSAQRGGAAALLLSQMK